MIKLKKFDKVEILWIDSSSSNSVWKTEEDFNIWVKNEIDMKELGYFMEFTKDSIVLCQGYSRYPDGQIGNLCRPFTIPRGCIKKIAKI